MTIRALLTLAAALAATAATADITTYGTQSAFNTAAGMTTVETFDSCGGTGSLGNNFVLSSANLGPCGSIATGISFAPVSDNALYIAGPGQSANSSSALGVDFPSGGYNLISFAGPNHAFAADFFQNFGAGHQSGSDATFTVAVFGTSGSLGSFVFPVPSGTGGFFGLTSTDSITSIKVSQAGGYAVIDNVSFSGGTVPEPATWAMMVGGLGLVGVSLRSRRRSVVAA
jgi:hypothetical protein